MMHMMVKPDLKQAIDFTQYLVNPTQMDHIRSSRILCSVLMVSKFMVGVIAETLLLLQMITMGDDIQQILINFVIFVVIY
jgi:hypothetical protein